MNTSLTTYKQAMVDYRERFEGVLQVYPKLPFDKLLQTVMVSMEKLPALAECPVQSVVNAAMSAACLGLEVDGYTGQAFLIPFKRRAQLVIGYKGYNTMAARSGFVINSAVVREGDTFRVRLGSQPLIVHEPLFPEPSDTPRAIVGAWAVAASNAMPSIFVPPMSLHELLAVKARAPGARKPDSPWNDPPVGFPAMCEKTVKRRTARGMPLNVMQWAAAMEEHSELGKHTYIDPERGVVTEDESGGRTFDVKPEPSAGPNLEGEPRWFLVRGDGAEVDYPGFEEWLANATRIANEYHQRGGLQKFVELNGAFIQALTDSEYADRVGSLVDLCNSS